MELPQTPSLRLDGKRALVTGASSGIGLGCAVALAEAGAHVVMAARGAEQLTLAVDAVSAKGLSAESLIMDISDVDSISHAMKSQDAFNVVVNSAGTACPKPALDTTPEDFQQVMDTNVFDNPERLEWIKSKIKLDRIGEVEDIMGCVLYLAGDASSLVTGASHTIDGGWTAG